MGGGEFLVFFLILIWGLVKSFLIDGDGVSWLNLASMFFLKIRSWHGLMTMAKLNKNVHKKDSLLSEVLLLKLYCFLLTILMTFLPIYFPGWNNDVKIVQFFAQPCLPTISSNSILNIALKAALLSS